MKFKDGVARQHMAAEWFNLHPRVREKLVALDDWSRKQLLPEPVITHINRTPSEQAAIYQGKKRFSWHMCLCAVDLRNFTYTAEQLGRVYAFLTDNHDPELWEVLSHDVGRGDHLHLAFRDAAWKTKAGF